VAPDHNQSGTSHSLSFHRPLRAHQVKDRHYMVDGTPTDCVMLGASRFVPGGGPDLILSGINHGANLGDDVHYSGTVSAAMEAGLMGLPAVAFS
jgi:5'-nucleotidase